MRSFLTLLLIVFVGCAGASDPTENQNNVPDVGDLDTGPTDEDSGAEDVGDEEPDVEEDVEEDPCPVCCAGDVRCGSQTVLETCRADGQAWVANNCSAEQICEDSECVTPPACTPGEATCFSSTQRIICRPDATGYVTETCPLDTICIGDQCLSGLGNGQACDDPGDCAGGLCRCGSDESCDLQSDAYCTSSCETNPCTGDQICWSPDGASSAAYAQCLRGCSQSCSISGMSCTYVLSEFEGDLDWRSGCLPPEIKGVGRLCTTDEECVNGNCRLDYYNDFGVCTHRCETDGCPTGTACVNLSGNGEYWCSPLCTNGNTFCPHDAEDPSIRTGWEVYCSARLTLNGSSAYVCNH